MAEQVSRVCDWRDEPGRCGLPGNQDFVAQIDETHLKGDLCVKHGHDLVEFLLHTAGMKVTHTLVDSKPRQTYVTANGKVVASRDIREWALAEGKLKTSHGRLPNALIEEYLAIN